MVADRENAALAATLIEETCLKQGIEPQVLTLHSDRGAPMTSKCTAQLLADLGVTRSLSRPQVSDDNPFSEAQFKTLKYHPGFSAARSAPCSTVQTGYMRHAHARPRWRPVQAGRPRAGAIPIPAMQARLRHPPLQIGRRNLQRGIPTHRDRQRAHRASPRQRLPPSRRRVAGIEPAPRLPMAACPAQYRRRWLQLSLHDPAVPAPSGSVTPPRARA